MVLEFPEIIRNKFQSTFVVKVLKFKRSYNFFSFLKFLNASCMSCNGLALNSSVTKLIGRTPCAITFILLFETNLK